MVPPLTVLQHFQTFSPNYLVNLNEISCGTFKGLRAKVHVTWVTWPRRPLCPLNVKPLQIFLYRTAGLNSLSISAPRPTKYARMTDLGWPLPTVWKCVLWCISSYIGKIFTFRNAWSPNNLTYLCIKPFKTITIDDRLPQFTTHLNIKFSIFSFQWVSGGI